MNKFCDCIYYLFRSESSISIASRPMINCTQCTIKLIQISRLSLKNLSNYDENDACHITQSGVIGRHFCFDLRLRLIEELSTISIQRSCNLIYVVDLVGAIRFGHRNPINSNSLKCIGIIDTTFVQLNIRSWTRTLRWILF